METVETRVREQLELYRCIPCHDRCSSIARREDQVPGVSDTTTQALSRMVHHGSVSRRRDSSILPITTGAGGQVPPDVALVPTLRGAPLSIQAVERSSQSPSCVRTCTRLRLVQPWVFKSAGPGRVLQGLVVLEHSRIPPGIHPVGGLLEGTTSSWTSRGRASLRESERLSHTSSSTRLRSLHFWFVKNGARPVHGRSGEYISLRSRGSC